MPPYVTISSFQPFASPGKFDLVSPIGPTGGSRFYKVPDQTADRLTEFEGYDSPNWDGKNALPITLITVQAARRFSQLLRRDVAPPDIAPGADGTLGFEWRHGPRGNRRFVLVEIGPGDIIKARKISEDGKIYRLSPISSEYEAIQNLVSMLFAEYDDLRD